jgi:aminoglycoside phosphotransferase family enzyme
VALPFLDFSSLAARERFCRRELELNQPNAPGLYREVLPVTRAPDGALTLGRAGDVVEWMLRMAPVPTEAFLDAVAARGALDGPLLDALADAVGALLAAAPIVPGVDSPGRMRLVLEGNLAGAVAAGLDPDRLAALGAAMRARLDTLAPLLAERAAQGFVRRCHRDLHLGKLCLWQGRPVAFDALEFDEAFASIDVGYEIAFLLMDLEARVSRAAANRVMNRLQARAPDPGMLAALPFWLAQRALVRAKLEPARGGDPLPYLAAAERGPSAPHRRGWLPLAGCRAWARPSWRGRLRH